MAKVLSPYRTYTAGVIDSRMSDTCDHSVVSSTVECTNIKMSKVKNVLGAGTYSLYDLCRHANVNPWSNFGPTVRSTTGTGLDKELVNSVPTVCSLGSFAGYHHDATEPGWQSGGQAAAEANVWVDSGGQATLSANIDIGEIDWLGDFGAHGIVMLIFDSTDAIIGWGQTDMSGIGSTFILTGTTAAGINMDHLDYYAMAFIVDTYPLAQSEDVVSALICKVPNISTWEVNLKVKPGTTTIFQAPGGFTYASIGYSNSPNPGRVSYTSIQSPDSYDEVRIYVGIYGYVENANIGEVLVDTIYSWQYDSFASGEGYPNGAWSIPDYGYVCYIRIEAVIY